MTLRTVDPATGLTSCCGAMSTYVDDTECCKACFEEVLSLTPGIVVQVAEGVRQALETCGHHGCPLRPGHIPGHTDR